jgi:hypothetical protein
MTQRITQMPKPDAEQYTGDRKLFLVPNFMIPPNAPQEGQDLLETYWSEVRTHIENLERSLGKVAHVYHEIVYADGDEGLSMVQEVNPKGGAFIMALCQSDAKLEAVEDRAMVEESTDWQRCLGVGLMSQKVVSVALDGFQEATNGRFEHIAKKIDETLAESETSVLFIGEGHKVQFPSDIRVFYVAPPSLDALKRWLSNPPPMPEPPAPEPPETSEGEKSSE